MLQKLIENLTKEQRARLREQGIERTHLYEWRTGKRLPTELQVAELAAAAGVSYDELQREVTILRAPESKRERVKALLGKLGHGAAVTLVCGAIAVALGAWNGRAVERFFPAR